MAKTEGMVAKGSGGSVSGVSGGESSSGVGVGGKAQSTESQSTGTEASGSSSGAPAAKKRKRIPPKQLKAGQMPKRLPLYYPKKPRTLKRPMIVQVDDDNLDLSA